MKRLEQLWKRLRAWQLHRHATALAREAEHHWHAAAMHSFDAALFRARAGALRDRAHHLEIEASR